MATQSVEFRAVTGQTITAKLFAEGSDTEVASVTATEATNRKGTYTAAFTDVPVGEYQLLAFNATPTPLASWWVTLTLATATFQVYERVDKDGITRSNWAALAVDHTSTGSTGAALGYIVTTVAAILVGVNQLTSRITTGVATMFGDLIQMIIGSGTVNARFTTKALENAPGGGAETGARTVSIKVTLDGSDLEGAIVRLTKGAETKRKTTNSTGDVSFSCDDGTWGVAITAPNASFDPVDIVVNGDETAEYDMTPDSVTPSDPPYITGTYIALDSNHVPASGISFSFYAAKPTTLDGYGQKNNVRTTTSGTGGLTSFTNLLPGTKYKIRRGTGEWYTVEIPADQTEDMDLTSLIGN